MSCILFGSLTALLCGFDLWCKNKVEKNMKVNEEKDICEGKIKLRNVRNRGMALNIGDKRPEYVVDYFGFCTKWKKFNRVTFNLGDIFIFIGAVFCVIGEMKGR